MVIILLINIILCIVIIYILNVSRESFFVTLDDNQLCTGGLYMHQGNSPESIRCRKFLSTCKGTCTNRCSECSCYPKTPTQMFEYNRVNF